MTTRREEGEYVRAEYGAGVGATRPKYEEEIERTRLRYGEGVESAGQRAREQGEQVRENVAHGLHSAAERLRGEAAERGQEGIGSRVAQPLERTSEYLERHSLSDIQHDAVRAARERPLVAAAGVFAAAFLVGRLLRRR